MTCTNCPNRCNPVEAARCRVQTALDTLNAAIKEVNEACAQLEAARAIERSRQQ